MTRDLVLGIEASGSVGSVCVRSPSGPQAADSRPSVALEETFGEGLIHGVALAPAVRRVLEQTGVSVSDLGLVAVGIGPGSYTGVRVATAFAKCLAHAAGLPVVGVPSLWALAARVPRESGPVVCVRDARRGTLYVAAYELLEDDAPRTVLPLGLRAIEEARPHLPGDALVVGDAAERYWELLSGEGRVLMDRRYGEVSSLAVAELGEREFRTRGPDDALDLAPLYLRPSEAEERIGSMRGTAG